MFFARSHIELHNLRQSIDRVGNLSDNVIHFGPIKLGLEAILEFVPFVGEIYSLVAGFMLVVQGARAHVPMTTLMSASVLIILRTGVGSFDAIPGLGIAGDLVAGAFRAHKISADMIGKAMDDTYYIEGDRRDAGNAEIMAEMKANKDRRRIVFLG